MRRERHLNVSVLGIRVSLIKTELPGYIFILSAISGKKKFWSVREVPGSSHISERGIVWWMNAGSGQQNRGEERMKGREKWLILSKCDIKSKSIKCARVWRFWRQKKYWQTQWPAMHHTSKHDNFRWQQFFCCVLLPALYECVCVCVCDCVCMFVERSLHLRAWLITLIHRGVGGDICSCTGVRARCVCVCMCVCVCVCVAYVPNAPVFCVIWSDLIWSEVRACMCSISNPSVANCVTNVRSFQLQHTCISPRFV